jgi:hypothetical protein
MPQHSTTQMQVEISGMNVRAFAIGLALGFALSAAR